MDKLKKTLGVNNDDSPSEEVGFAAQFTDTTSLTWSTRIQGFALCFGLGFILSTIGAATILIPPGGIKRFAILYTLGNVLSIGSTLFLMGPLKQIKKMFNETRYLATLAMLGFMFLTIVAAFKGKIALCIIFCILEFFAMLYYSLSYIPFARDAVRRTVVSLI